MSKINWDFLFEQDCESTPGCPWKDQKPIDDGLWNGPDDEDEEDGEDDE